MGYYSEYPFLLKAVPGGNPGYSESSLTEAITCDGFAVPFAVMPTEDDSSTKKAGVVMKGGLTAIKSYTLGFLHGVLSPGQFPL